ncbi:protein-S-isoprenylcysteine O-methyltransferase-like isoform X1 [Macrosteles quadrilineatus]|uniref:protein-S-isoprenylcysteine O-methyltransferase-like isoform X1 n=1 Tax=Macrosteles quadrilineatus TaxID=74068 RepID=UPI0023E112BC|nr:protein-S-isoprenylcysteine O-methyltransferase-like isoform X1 [Macrosteles quadrilineatus]
MIVKEAKLSLFCFISPTILPVLSLITPHFRLDLLHIDVYSIIWLIYLTNIVFMNLIVFVLFSGYLYQVAVRATFLGSVFTGGLLVAFLLPNPWIPYGWYMCVMAFFHYSEFLTIALTNPRTLTIDSFILNHSNEYMIAAVSSWVEFFIEAYFFPELKTLRLVSYVGLSLCIGGECLRKCAMWTARTNFNHVVQSVRHNDHQLVTHGIYSVCRHPSYVGWFYWSMGTQMILVNPLCFVAYILASWKFFHDRIMVEEITLINFFGEQYLDYQKKVSTGLPFIRGTRRVTQQLGTVEDQGEMLSRVPQVS